MPKKVDMQPIRVMDTRKENVVPSGIQARMAALFDKIEPAQGPAAPAPPAYVRRLKMPELAQGAQASKNAKIQREVEALRSLNRVGNGGQRLLKTKAFGGNGVANRQDREKQQNRYSLECISVIERIKRERTEKA
ncbi:hypothetical protein PsYK624_090920 [Phanerochaete sordida]|uniref:Uncharacterized protein n=1 Tax=Phanerochaete sordida TaxID=48140 RepID=A0A9P3GDK2_9APHY|nr:hypothetical protein PsYK624_090920 [Phanerochaete sordida]